MKKNQICATMGLREVTGWGAFNEESVESKKTTARSLAGTHQKRQKGKENERKKNHSEEILLQTHRAEHLTNEMGSGKRKQERKAGGGGGAKKALVQIKRGLESTEESRLSKTGRGEAKKKSEKNGQRS